MDAPIYFLKSHLKTALLFSFLIYGNNGWSIGPKNWIIIEYLNADDSLSNTVKDNAYFEYLRSKEGDYVYFQFKNPFNYNPYSSYSDCKKLCDKLSAFFIQKGLVKEDVIIKNVPEPCLLVFKKNGISNNANFISLPKSWEQTFIISNQKGGVCNTKNGHKIVFPPNAFEVISGDSVSIEVYEIDSKKKFIESGYTATSGDQLLESNGMFKVAALQGHQEIKIKPDAEVEIKYKKEAFENPDQASSYNTFYGSENNNEIDWQPNLNQKITNSSKPIEVISTTTYSYTETHYVQLCRKIALLEPKIASSLINCVLIEKDYNFLVSKYGILMYRNNDDYPEVKSYQHYTTLLSTKKDLIFIGLTAEQNAKLENDELLLKQKEEAKRAAEEKERKKQELAAAKAQEIIDNHPIGMKINQLGNINCDRFYDVPNKTDIIVKLNDTEYDQIRVLAVFNDIKSVIHGSYLPTDKGSITFHNLPQGKNVVYLAALFKGKEVKMAYISKSITKKDVVYLTVKSYTNQQYEKILDELIPN